MSPPLETPAEELKRLRGCLDDLASIMALPSDCAGSELPQILGTLLDTLVRILGLDFAFVRVDGPEGGPPMEMARVAEPWERSIRAPEIIEALEKSLGDAPLQWPPRGRLHLGDVAFSISSTCLGLDGELGIVVAGSQKVDFPGQTEALLLDVASSQAVLGLQKVRLLGEEKRVAREVDERVEQRTREVATANEELKKSEREARLIVDNIPGLVAVLTATGDLEAVNRQVFEYFGRTLQELSQWATNDTVHPADLPNVIDVFTRSIASGSPFDIIQRFRRSDGVYRWFRNRGFPVRETNGQITRWCVLLTDIDDRKRAEDAVRASERDLKLIIDTIPALAWSARADGSAEFFNQLYLDYMGLSAEQAGDWGWTSVVHPDDLNGLAATWQRILNSENPGEIEARLRRHDGEYRWFLFRASPLHDEKGSIVKWYGINTDIDRRKRAEADLRRAYLHFADAQRLSKTGSFLSDLLVDEHYWSEEARRIFEFDPASKVTVQMFRDRIHPEDLPSMDAVIGRGMEGVDVEFAFRIVTSRGVRHLRGTAHVIEEVGGGRPLFSGALQDVTEIKASEDALNNARSELAHVARVTTLSAFSASIAHEVNQPLSGIITNASTCLRMLNGDPPNVEGARETARRTIRDGGRAADVITRLRTLFSKKEFAGEPLDLNEATREVIALSLSDFQRNQVIVRLELADDLALVTGDRVQLQQVILNLLRNASDAMVAVGDRPRQMLIKTEREDGDRVRLTVQDAGVGVDSQSMDKLFDAFYTTKGEGMGIGLSVSRSIIERHHGRLWMEPNDGPGATFSFSIPRDPENVTAPAREAATS